MISPLRPIMRYHGGKWRLAPWVTQFFPDHTVYVEPFGGSAAVLLRKERARTEIYNELDNELFNLFRVLRDPILSEQLGQALQLTPYARAEYEAAFEPSKLPVEQARRTLVKAWFGTFSKGLLQRSGFDTRINEEGFCSRVGTFIKLPELIPFFRERLTGVILENTDALSLIPRVDARHTLFYVDPPYLHDTRSGKYYRHELDDAGHRRLAEVLRSLEGMVVVSGYPCDLYDRELYPDWHREECPSFTDGGHARTEVLWMNGSVKAQLDSWTQLSLYQ